MIYFSSLGLLDINKKQNGERIQDGGEIQDGLSNKKSSKLGQFSTKPIEIS
jgi:hypothetical protein